jgi:hypothetical protein
MSPALRLRDEKSSAHLEVGAENFQYSLQTPFFLVRSPVVVFDSREGY